MRILTFLAVLFSITVGRAQDSTLTYQASVVVAGSTQQTPLWLQANKNGIIPSGGTYAAGYWELNKRYQPGDPRLLQWSAGVSGATNYELSKGADVFLVNAYGAARLGPVELMVGQRGYTVGLTDSLLTSGSLTMSGNARPYPRIQLAIPEFTYLSFTSDFVAIKAAYSDGVLASSRILYGSAPKVSETYIHHKQLYFRFGGSHSRVRVYVGANHQVIWGGEDKLQPILELSKYGAYQYVITGKSLYRNKLGNHFGTADLGLEWHLLNWSIFGYRQNIYDSGLFYQIRKPADGLTGLKITRRHPGKLHPLRFNLQTAILEYSSTGNQQSISNPQNILFQNGNYYNHYIYQTGWSYHGRNMGTPMVGAADAVVQDERTPEFTANNRFWMIHGGITALWLKGQLLAKATYSQNDGTFLRPFEKTRQSLSLLLSYEKQLPFLKSCSLTTAAAADLGSLYPNSISLQIGLKKTGYLN